MNSIRDALMSAIALLRVLQTVQVDSGDAQDNAEIEADIVRTEEQLSNALELITDMIDGRQN